MYGCYFYLCVNVSVPLLALLAAAQTMGPRPATAAAAAATPVRGVPQYKYAAGVRNPQQHMSAQPQVTMQQVGMHRPTHRFCPPRAKVQFEGEFQIFCLTFNSLRP